MPPEHRNRTFRPSPRPGPRPATHAPQIRRPPTENLTSLASKVTRLDLPHGCFNAGLAPLREGYVCVYRPDEHSFAACRLTPTLAIVPRSTIPLGITNCADPRLTWLPDGRLLMVYSSHDTGSFRNECIRGGIVMDNIDGKIHPPESFRISMPSAERQKNWMPFVSNDRVYLIASVQPHTVYELSDVGRFATPCSEAEWTSPWFYSEFLRGNTNAVQLSDGRFLGTFHTAVKLTDKLHFYDNGCYVFEGKPPFTVVRCSHRTYLPAEAAVEPHFRKAGRIKVCFPVGMVRDGERLLISYGDNDSSVKIMETTVAEMLTTTLAIY